MEFFGEVGGGNPYKPSLFELVAQEQLRDLLQPALKYVLSVFAQRNPRYLLRIVNRHEEFYAAIMFFVERHYLRKHGASFSENFYGLKRRRKPVIETERARAAVGGPFDEEKLKRADILKSLLFLVGVPYARAKAQDYYEQLGGGVDSDIIQDNPSARRLLGTREGIAYHLRRTFKLVYPWFNTSYELFLLGYNVAYLFDKTAFYRPWLALIGLDIRRMGPEDYQKLSAASTTMQPKRNILSILRRLLISSPRLLLDSLKILLPLSIFFVKFLEWWYSPASPARSLTTTQAAPRIPPPRLLPPHRHGKQVDGLKYGMCPLCEGPIVNPTALPSGYVFCYTCAHSHVEEHKKCPVTLLPARVWQLRKVLV